MYNLIFTYRRSLIHFTFLFDLISVYGKNYSNKGIVYTLWVPDILRAIVLSGVSLWVLSYLKLLVGYSYTDLIVPWLFFMLFLNCVWYMQLSSSNFRSSGSTRRGVVSSSRDATVGNETEPSHPLTVDASQGALRKISGAQRSSPIMPFEHNRTSSGRNTSNMKNYESTIRGIETLNFNDERLQY